MYNYIAFFTSLKLMHGFSFCGGFLGGPHLVPVTKAGAQCYLVSLSDTLLCHSLCVGDVGLYRLQTISGGFMM